MSKFIKTWPPIPCAQVFPQNILYLEKEKINCSLQTRLRFSFYCVSDCTHLKSLGLKRNRKKMSIFFFLFLNTFLVVLSVLSGFSTRAKYYNFETGQKFPNTRCKFSAKHKTSFILPQRFKTVICALVCACHRTQELAKWQWQSGRCVQSFPFIWERLFVLPSWRVLCQPLLIVVGVKMRRVCLYPVDTTKAFFKVCSENFKHCSYSTIPAVEKMLLYSMYRHSAAPYLLYLQLNRCSYNSVE